MGTDAVLKDNVLMHLFKNLRYICNICLLCDFLVANTNFNLSMLF